MNKVIRALMARKAAAAKDARAISDKAVAENRDLTTEEQASIDAKLGEIQVLSRQIDTQTALAQAEADAGLELPDDARISGGEPAVAKDPKRGFKSLGDFAKSVHAASQPGASMEKRLAIAAALPTNYGNESSGSDGGFAIPPEFSTNIWRLSLGEDSLLPLTSNVEVNGNSMAFPKDESTPWGGTGIKAYWRNEATAVNATKPALGVEQMRLHDMMALVPMTNELLEDSTALSSFLAPQAGDSIMWKTNEAILFGTGQGQPLGALVAAGPLITQAAESGQATATIVPTNIGKMVSRLKVGELGNAVWMGNPDIIPALEAMTVGNYPIYLSPGMGVKEAPYGMLKGRPLLLSEHANGLGQKSDLSLLSLKGYRTITKAGSGVETATSMHLYFDVNATAFRFIFRIDGKPIISAPIAAPTGKSSNSRSYFVTLAARP